MSLSLYEIDSAIAGLVDAETGEVFDFEAMDKLKMQREQKIENIALYYKNLTAEAKAIRAEEIALEARRKVIEKNADSLGRYLTYALDGEKFHTSRCAVDFRRTKSVKVESEEIVTEWLSLCGHANCLRFKAPEINKKTLGELLKTGVEVPCAYIVENLSVGVK